MEFYISPQSGQFYMINVLENQWLSVTHSLFISCLVIFRYCLHDDTACVVSVESSWWLLALFYCIVLLHCLFGQDDTASVHSAESYVSCCDDDHAFLAAASASRAEYVQLLRLQN